MITTVADGVRVHQSECIQSNAVIVDGTHGALVIDAGITRKELTALAAVLQQRGTPAVVAFSTHPDWDHVLWHPDLGDVPRYGTARCASTIREFTSKPDWVAGLAAYLPPEFADDIPMELLGDVAGVPEGTELVPWDGPSVRIFEHRAHAPGHAALLVESARVLVAGDMLSDVLVPMLDFEAVDPSADYLETLDMLEQLSSHADAVVPGHGSVGPAGDLKDRIALDRAYVNALASNNEPDDPRIGEGAAEGWEWVADVHRAQQQALRSR